ncbi:MAG TPA: glycoside hydrolase family 18 protein [Candidatus Dormibacteraeota bacterium]|nr:glycoside hydrolase family 18 protein [Candidatus Dormibacteraeota bacterium]
MRRASTVRGALSGLLASALLLTSAGTASAGSGAGQDGQRGDRLQRVAYFVQWGIYARQYFVKNVATSGQAARLTTINYAFGGISADGTCTSLDTWADFQRPVGADESVDGVADAPGQALNGNFNQLRKLKAQFPHLRVVMSLGGFTGSTFFSDVALTPQSRQKFVASCLDMFIAGNLPSGAGAGAGVFDGIDIDWEWPVNAAAEGTHARPEDRANFTLLLAEFRRQLDALGRQAHQHYVLTAFLPADPAKIASGFEVPQIFRSLDWATVQGYDLHGTWESTTNFQSALFSPSGDPSTPTRFSVDLAIQSYLARHAPARKLVLGVPFYSRGWTGVTNANHGLFQPSTGAAPGTFEAGVDDFKVVAARPGFQLFRDRRDGVAWLFDGTTFWTFDDPTALREKMAYVTDHRLGGAMAWSLDADDAQASLVRALDAGLSDADRD